MAPAVPTWLEYATHAGSQPRAASAGWCACEASVPGVGGVISGAPALVFYISGHGFGHASRDIEVLNALHATAPRVRLVVRTSAPRWLFDLTLRAPVRWLPLECDTGVVQIDSLRLDAFETVRRAAAYAAAFDDMAAREAVLLRELQARRWSSATFRRSRSSQRTARACRRSPLATSPGTGSTRPIRTSSPRIPRSSSGFAAPTHTRRARFACRWTEASTYSGRVDPVPFIARRSIRTGGDVRERFGLPKTGALVLVSFGGYGLRDIDLGALASLRDYTVVVTANVTPHAAETIQAGEKRPEAAGEPDLPASVRFLDERAIYAAGYRYEDLVGPSMSSPPSRATESSPSASPTTRRCSTRRAGISPSTTSWSARCRASCAAGSSRTKICTRAPGSPHWTPCSRSPHRRSVHLWTAPTSSRGGWPRRSPSILDASDERPDPRDVHLLD